MFNASEKTLSYKLRSTLLALILVGWMGVLMLSGSGCRTARDNQFEILERELRTQEDYIYELEDYVVEYSQKLRQCRCAQPSSSVPDRVKSNSIVKKSKPADKSKRAIEPLQIEEGPLYDPLDDSPEPTQPEQPLPQEKEPRDLEMESEIPDNFEIPELEIGEPVGQYNSTSTTSLAAFEQDLQTAASEDEQTVLIPAPVALQELEQLDQQQLQVATESLRPAIDNSDEPAESVVISRLFRNEQNDAPLQTILAVIETHSSDGIPVEFLGKVSLMVMTDAEEKPQRLMRWDFNIEDAAMAWQSSHLGEGLHLELPLGETELPDIPLELWVRIIDPNGKKLLSQRAFHRQELVALEAETGAQELLVVGEKEDQPVANDQSDVGKHPEHSFGWRAASEWNDIDSQELTSTVNKASGWSAQPASGRKAIVSNSKTTSKSSSTTKGSKPVWTASR